MENKRKKTARLLAAIIMMCAAVALMQACSAVLPDNHIDLADSFEGEGIVTAEQLIEFINEGEDDTASLLAPIDLGREMLKVSAQRGTVTIEGNGFSVIGNGDCAIRLDDGAAVILNDICITSAADAIGCLGNAFVGGVGLEITAAGNGIIAKGMLNIAQNSEMNVESIEGSALNAKGINIGAGAKLDTSAGLNAVHTTKNDLVLDEGAELYAYTQTNYNAVKCADTLVMAAGSVFSAENGGEYHGAEIDMLSIDGIVTIRCKGGSKGMGIFVFTQNEDVCVLGSCSPQAQYENGGGSITFAENIDEFTAWSAQKAAEQAEEAEGEDEASDQADTEGEN